VNTQTVLVVDDDHDLRFLVRVWAESLGYRVREAESAEEALERMHAEPAQIAFCDVNMIGQSGIWLAAQLRDRYPDTAIVVASAARDVETAIASLRNDVIDYLLKPFDRDRLAEALALARDWHNAAAGNDQFQHALQDRLRQRRASVATTLAGAQDSFEEAVESLIAMLHERAGRAPAPRVPRLAVALAEQLGLNDDDVRAIEYGALLHDIGKLDMPSSILAKPAPLNDDEWQVMRRHPEIGYELLKQQPRFARSAAIVWSHHESYDGSGYPRGLAGTEIPFGARILAVADAYDSMTQPHTQRPALPPLLAVEEIERCSGHQFDPSCVAALGVVMSETAAAA
jgi:putative two-component system response regulator